MKVPPTRLPAENRRHQIIQAAIEVFAQRGFQGATTKQIAEAAGVSEAIIFRHFATKQDLYGAILDHKAQESGQEEWLKEVRALADASDDEALFYALIRHMIESHRRDPAFHRIMVYAALEGREFSKVLHGRRWPIHKLLCDYIAKRQKSGALRKCDPELMLLAMVGMPAWFGMVTQVFGIDCVARSDDEAARTFTSILMDGIRKNSKNTHPVVGVRNLRSLSSHVPVPIR